jgi:predicted dehydrogenase
VDLNFVEQAYRRSCVLAGSVSSARWDWTAATVVLRCAGVNDQTFDVPCDLADTYRAVVQDFVDAIEQGHRPRTSAEQCVAAVEVAEAVHESASRGRRIVLT